MEWRESGSVRYLHHGMAGVEVIFGSRVGGFSKAPFDTLNAGVGTSDDPETVIRNRAALSKAAGLEPGAIAMARQVHSDAVIAHEEPPVTGDWETGSIPETSADAHTTDRLGLGLAVLTADCLPIALSGSRGLGLAHCGWRGLALGLAGKIAGVLGATEAAIGPGIGPCCYEVGDEVIEQLGDEETVVAGSHLDLVKVAVGQLEGSGVTEIASSGICTCCAEDEFFSHRRDGPTTGRQATIAWLN